MESAKRFPDVMDTGYRLLLRRRTAAIEAMVRDDVQPVVLNVVVQQLADKLSAMDVSSDDSNRNACLSQLRSITAALEDEVLRHPVHSKASPIGPRSAAIGVCEDEVFPAKLCCDLQCSHCVDATRQPYEARPVSRKPHEAWVFVGSTVRRQPVIMCKCESPLHPEDVVLRPAGVEWSTRTGLFNVGDRWFFSLLVLEDVTRDVHDLEVPVFSACQKRVQESFDFMRDASGVDVALPDLKTASDKMYDAWYAYECVLKECDFERYSICKFCGILPPKIGTDACAKVAMNLSHREAREQLDFQRKTDQPLWTQDEVLDHCKKHLMACTTSGGTCMLETPIPVFLVPPMFLHGIYAAETVVNTECDKQTNKSDVGDASHVGEPNPSTACLQPMADAVYAGRLDPVTLRDGGYGQTEMLNDLLQECGCPTADHSKMTSDAAKRRWLLKGYETLKSGDSDCHLFTCVKRGTGGTVNATCPHGVVLAYKWLFLKETNRDHADVCRSFVLHPAVHFVDDSCGQV